MQRRTGTTATAGTQWMTDMHEEIRDYSSPNEQNLELLLHDASKEDESRFDAREVEDAYSYCGGRLHVVLLTKMIALAALPFYLLIIVFISICGNATSIMFSVIILGSVSVFTFYGAFNGSKMCLIPFVVLQVVFFIYDLVLIGLLFFAAVYPDCFVSALIRSPLVGVLFDSTQVLLFFCALLIMLLGPLIWSTHVVYLDFLFISQVDETLHFLKEANQKYSQDELSPSRINF